MRFLMFQSRFHFMALRRLVLGIWVFFGAFIPVSCYSASFEISPVKLSLSSQQPVTVMSIKNKGRDSKLVQIELRLWEQNDGLDVYSASRDLLASPPIFELAPGQTQMVRVGLRQDEPFQYEKSYRLFVQEVPLQARQAKQLNMALRFSIPVFVAPVNNDVERSSISWKAHIGSSGSLHLTALNSGGRHAKISELSLNRTDENGLPHKVKGLFYLLPGAKRSWTFQVGPSFNKNEKIQLKVSQETGEEVMSLLPSWED